MPRPKRCRRIGCCPPGKVFKPQGIPERGLDRIELGMDELEALRLIDMESLSQSEAAERMRVSQPTLSRVLAQGRRKVAEAIVMGKSLHIVADASAHVRVEGGAP